MSLDLVKIAEEISGDPLSVVDLINEIEQYSTMVTPAEISNVLYQQGVESCLAVQNFALMLLKATHDTQVG